jgi:hypothetical protein
MFRLSVRTLISKSFALVEQFGKSPFRINWCICCIRSIVGQQNTLVCAFFINQVFDQAGVASLSAPLPFFSLSVFRVSAFSPSTINSQLPTIL